MGRGSVDLLGVVEAAYRFELDEPRWLASLLASFTGALALTTPAIAFTFDDHMARGVRTFHGLDDRSRRLFVEWMPRLSPAFVRGAFLTSQASYLSDLGEAASVLAMLRATGEARDTVAINSVDPDGIGVFVGGAVGRSPPVRTRLATSRHLLRVCSHLSSAYKLRRRLESSAPVLSAREHEIMAAAALGHHNKLIAFQLGLAHSTVRVLVSRAMAKLGATSRKDAIARFSAMVQATR